MSVQWQQRDGWRQYNQEWWDDLHKDLAELELRGALDGIRAVIAERLAMVRAHHATWPGALERARAEMPDAGLLDAPRIAALLAAEIDRAAGGE